MSKYIQAFDSLPNSDTLDLGLKLLKAYHHNDIDYLKKEYAGIATYLEQQRQTVKFYTREEPLPINKLNFEEAYKFEYWAAFCSKSIAITIGKRENAIILDVYLYSYYPVNSWKKNWETISHTTKQVDNKVWEEIIKGIAFSDFWGLEKSNGKYGFDGSELKVTGYESPTEFSNARYKKVDRWAAENTALGQVFKELLDLSGNKVDCFHY